jgi:hypothetical protein
MTRIRVNQTSNSDLVFLMINEMNIEFNTALLVMKLNEFETNDTYV